MENKIIKHLENIYGCEAVISNYDLENEKSISAWGTKTKIILGKKCIFNIDGKNIQLTIKDI